MFSNLLCFSYGYSDVKVSGETHQVFHEYLVTQPVVVTLAIVLVTACVLSKVKSKTNSSYIRYKINYYLLINSFCLSTLRVRYTRVVRWLELERVTSAVRPSTQLVYCVSARHTVSCEANTRRIDEATRTSCISIHFACTNT